MKVATDAEVTALLTPRLAADAARRAVLDAWQGKLTSPPRSHAEAGAVDLTFTVGGYVDGPVGFRVYGTWSGASDQLVAIWSLTGELRGVIVGGELGMRRTGALGAVAADALARVDARRVAIIGSGPQAWAQLWALTAVRELSAVRVFSSTRAHRDDFCERARRELALDAVAAEHPQRAVEDADIVILATRSATPVIEAGWVGEGVHVTTIGPKTASAHETPLGLVDRAELVASDSPQQATGYGEPFFTARSLVHLGSVLDGTRAGRTSQSDLTMYCSTGLAGSEVVVGDALLDAMSAV